MYVISTIIIFSKLTFVQRKKVHYVKSKVLFHHTDN